MKIAVDEKAGRIQQLRTVVLATQERISKADREARKAREKHREEKLNRDFDTERRKIAEWCKGKQRRQLEVLKNSGGTLTASVKELDQIMRTAWKPVFRLYDTQPPPDYHSFDTAFGKHVKHRSMECPR